MTKLMTRVRAAVWRVPVGWQLSTLYTLLLAVTLVALGWALYLQLDRFLIDNRLAELQDSVRSTLARTPGFDHSGPSYPGGNSYNSANDNSSPYPPLSADRAFSMLIRNLSAPDVTVAVLDTDGKVLLSTPDYNDDAPRTLPDLPAQWQDQVQAITGANGQTVAKWVVAGPNGGRELLVVQPFTVRVVGATTSELDLLLMQAASLEASDAVLNQLRLYLLIGIIIGTIVGVVAGLALTRAVLKPLDNMASTAQAIAAGDLNRRMRLPSGGNEVARLGGAFDHMVERLSTTLQAQRRFIADASHELRTPLTSLEGLSEVLLLGADRGDSRAIQRVVRSMHGELSRMSRLVSDLLTLSRLDTAGPIEFVPLDLSKLIEDVAEQVAPMAETRQAHIVVAHNGPTMVQAEPDRLRQVILNLVDNALRYTPPDGQVRLTTTLDAGHNSAQIEVADDGPGITPEDLPHIFDRFYRGDASRTRATGNSGLGLAIAQGIVQAHGGAITAQSTPGSGARFTVTLPTTH